jgi:hypothetical protein
MSELDRLMPLLIVFAAAFMVVALRRARVALADRRVEREKAEARELARMTGYIKKIRPGGAGPAIQRDRHGNVDLFAGLRRYRRSGRKTRRSREV